MRLLLIVLWAIGSSLVGLGQSVSEIAPSVVADTLNTKEFSQKLVRNESKPYMMWQVKHVSEFIARFNHEALPGGKKFTDSSRMEYPRDMYLRRLFNEDDVRFKRTRLGLSSLYSQQVDEFINTVTTHDIKISSQSPIEAVSKLRVIHHHLTDTLVVKLRKYYTADSASYWQIVQVKRPQVLRDSQSAACDGLEKQQDLPPNSHEVNFLPLLRGLSDYRSFCPFMNSDSRLNKDWQCTEAALRNGTLHIESVVSTTIYIPIGTEWQLELNEFLYEKENSGWLISNLIQLAHK
ncbi:hypothetical protein [Telluribacter humicola]|uniref:hypothetical protein n=1 Tax=Telluribacter humicola TaxID=1720261 RepID=UPI001A96F16E|nr:hypothetical protein [Telluribacter humicola]